MGSEDLEGGICVSGSHSNSSTQNLPITSEYVCEQTVTASKVSRHSDILENEPANTRQTSYPHSIFCQVTEKVSTVPLTKLSPFERLLVTARGDLQRIISSWCYEIVSVEVLYYCLDEKASTETEKRYKRKVRLKCRNREFCTAHSEVVLSDKLLIDSLATNKVGIGQLFRQYNLLPKFELTGFQQSDTCSFSRRYSLTAPGIKCIIEEVFDVAEIRRLEHIVIGEVILQQDLVVGAANTDNDTGTQENKNMSGAMSASMKNNRLLSVPLNYNSTDFSPFERVLLSAYDNVPRLVSSYLNSPVELLITHTHKMGENRYSRVVELKCVGNKKLFCVATCEFTILDQILLQQVDTGELELNDIFRMYRGGSLPVFKLVSASKIKDAKECQIETQMETDIGIEAVENSNMKTKTMPMARNEQGQGQGNYSVNKKLGPKPNALHRCYILSTEFAQVQIQELFEPWISEVCNTRLL